MSRIERTPVSAGDATDATELNATYADYTQSGALDEPNTRDQAFDIPHFTNAPIVLNVQESQLGDVNLHPQAFFIAGGSVTLTATTNILLPLDHAVEDTGGTPTPLNLGASGWSMVSGDVLRLWWSLSVQSAFVAWPWRAATALGRYDLEDTGGGPDNTITDGMHCWVAYLEWDITSNALGNFVPVPNQTDFKTNFTVGGVAYKGGYVNQMASTSVISAWAVYSGGTASDGQVPDPSVGTNEVSNAHGWYAVSGMWAYPATGSVTVYGVRVKITGLLHPLHVNGGNSENLLVYDIPGFVATPTLLYGAGRISAVQMRGS